MRSSWGAVALLVAVAFALALRAPHLATRPIHNDEAVNAVKVSDLWQRGQYTYDPDHYHGPVLHYVTLPFLWLSGAGHPDKLDDAWLRLAPVVFGIGLILLLPLLSDGLGRCSLAWAALFIAVSPAMVFYSRYFIHEMVLVFFTALTLAAGWRYSQNPSSRWAAIAGAGFGLMFATKETFVLSIAAMGFAALATASWNRPMGVGLRRLAGRWNWNHAGLGFLAAFVVWLTLFSSFFTHFGGLVDSFRTYLPWLERAGGHSPHVHPWYFYLQRLAWFHPVKGPAWSEGVILILAAVGAIVSFTGKATSLRRFLALQTLLLTAVYSAITYKTPWCLLNFYYGMILLAGVGAAALVECSRPPALRVGVAVALLGCALQLAWQAWRASFVYSADRRNPYVYAQTVPDVLNLAARADGLAGVAQRGYETGVKIIAPGSDYWPLPWYLRRFRHVGWYEKLPDDPFAPIVVVSSKLDARLDDKSDRKWIMAGLFELRPEKFFELYVEIELWKRYVETLPRPRD